MRARNAHKAHQSNNEEAPHEKWQDVSVGGDVDPPEFSTHGPVVLASVTGDGAPCVKQKKIFLRIIMWLSNRLKITQ